MLGNNNEAYQAPKKILIVTSVFAERDAITRGLRDDQRFDVLAAGVGSALVAANTAAALNTGEYKLVINMGIGGCFIGRAEVGSVVVATESIAADLGAETVEGFMCLEELNLGVSRVRSDLEYSLSVVKGIQAAGIPVNMGSILTVSTVTGTLETANTLSLRHPEALAEAMEGYGVAIAAQINLLPVLEIRAMSNAVGPRDRGKWKMKEALERLEQVSTVLTEVL